MSRRLVRFILEDDTHLMIEGSVEVSNPFTGEVLLASQVKRDETVTITLRRQDGRHHWVEQKLGIREGRPPSVPPNQSTNE